jgi:hypothetical protein
MECLPSKPEALSSEFNPHYHREREREREKGEKKEREKERTFLGVTVSLSSALRDGKDWNDVGMCQSSISFYLLTGECDQASSSWGGMT